MMKIAVRTLPLCIVLGLTGLTTSLQASADRVTRFERSNPQGGTTAGTLRHQSGQHGGSFSQRRVVRTDEAGNTHIVGGSSFQTPGGASGARAGTTTYNSDGSVQHRSGMTASGTRGSVTSNGGYTVSAEGDVSQSRSTTVTNASNGNTYQGNLSYDQSNGLNHSGTCYDATGKQISCPTR